MGQEEVLKFLERNKGKWFSSREISEALNRSPSIITLNLSKLRKTNFIKFKECEIHVDKTRYKYKIN